MAGVQAFFDVLALDACDHREERNQDGGDVRYPRNRLVVRSECTPVAVLSPKDRFRGGGRHADYARG